ncbi:acyltransferase family-domain-containing protein [Tribonema minus]|uniref:Acyltransferase family-domain-containing protein n=1 Tax=Tribonema minus TaxID=303371 RepID=A0A835Z165_9STRA|nr:acyltransferase family-domain-containing protein [Tribonema minus]
MRFSLGLLLTLFCLELCRGARLALMPLRSQLYDAESTDPPLPPITAVCASICGTIGKDMLDCQERCLALLQPDPSGPANPCRSAIAAVSTDTFRIEAMSFSSGHIASAIGLLLQAANGSAAAAQFLPYVNDLGAPDACAAVDGAHYCLVAAAPGASPLPLRLGACLPRACRQDTLGAMTNLTAVSVSLSCGDHSYGVDGAARALTLALFAAVALLVVVGTALELAGCGAPPPPPQADKAKEHSGAADAAAPTHFVSGGGGGDDQCGSEQHVSDGLLDDQNLQRPLLPTQADDKKRGGGRAHGGGDAHGGSGSGGSAPLAVRVLLCFGLQANWRYLFDVGRGRDGGGGGGGGGNRLAVLDGLRALSILWVILGHTLIFCLLAGGYSNLLELVPRGGRGVLARLSAQAITSAFLSVDTFFYISGFLLTHVTLSKLSAAAPLSRGAALRWLPALYLHRWLRITPTFMAAVLLYWQVLPLLDAGPLWDFGADDAACSKYWWTNPLYISNLVPWRTGLPCFPVGWYLANDFQFALAFLPLLLLGQPLRGRAAATAAVAALCALAVAASCAFALWLGLAQGVRFTVFDGGLPAPGAPQSGGYSYWPDYYIRPWSRVVPYAAGVLAALGWRRAAAVATAAAARRPAAQRAAAANAAVTVAWAALLGSTVYGTYWAYQDVPSPISRGENAAYLALARLAWSLGLTALCFQCFANRGGAVQALLAHRAWAPLSKLTFCAYLVHPTVITWFYRAAAGPTRFGEAEFAVTYMGFALGTFAASVPLYLAVEAPLRRVEAALLPRPK